MFENILNLIRYKHWIKNLIIFAPLIFSDNLLIKSKVIDVLIVFFYFCIFSSAIYIFNDLCDYQSDKKISFKKAKKPIANGDISLPLAKNIFIFTMVLSIVLIYLTPSIRLPAISFLILNILYSIKLKHIVIVDLFTVCLSYILRVFSGALVIDVEFSNLMFATIFSAALFLISLKRQKEFSLIKKLQRRVMVDYNKNIFIFLIITSLSVTLSLYAIYIINFNKDLIYTFPLLLFIFFRYLVIYIKEKNEDSPVEIFLKDYISIIASLTFSFWILFSYIY